MIYISLLMACLICASIGMMFMFRDHIVFFYSPSDLYRITQEEGKQIPPSRLIRIGGIIREGSIKYDESTLQLEFVVDDMEHVLRVRYTGLLPPMFRDGQGTVAEGYLWLNKAEEGAADLPFIFKAEKLLTKHDENYMPPEVADALKKSGNWRGE